MDLNPTNAQKEIQAAARELSQKEIAPVADKVDLREIPAHELLPKIGAAGLLSIPVPREYGGGGGDMISMALALEEMAAASAAVALAAQASGCVAALLIAEFGDEKQISKYLPGMARGESIGCFALTEPHCGPDVAAIDTIAEKRNGAYALNGVEARVINGPDMDACIVFARAAGSEKADGVSAFIVDKDTPGLSAGAELDMLCARGLMVSELVMKDCEVPAGNLIGEDGAGYDIAMRALDYSRLTMAAIGMGLIRAAMDESIKCAESRWAAGKLLGAFQEINHRIADMRMNLEVGRQLLYHAAWRMDRGEKCAADIAIAKLFSAENAFRAVADAVQIQGNAGLMRGGIVERLYRDVKICSLSGGATEVMRAVIARDTLA